MVKIYLEMKQYEIPWGVGEKESNREKFKEWDLHISTCSNWTDGDGKDITGKVKGKQVNVHLRSQVRKVFQGRSDNLCQMLMRG